MTGGCPDTHGETKPRTEALGMEEMTLLVGILTANLKALALALIAAQFMTAGDEETERLRKANALYNAACEYAKRFGSLSPDEQAIEVHPEKALRELGEREDLAIGHSESDSPALAFFRKVATTKTERHITYRAFVKAIERHFGPFHAEYQFPETMAAFALVGLHSRIRQARSHTRSERRKKAVKKNRTKRKRRNGRTSF